MGQKSRNKKNRKPNTNKTVAQAKAVKTVTPESLKSGSNPVTKAVLMDVQTEYIRSDILQISLLLIIVALIIGGLSLMNYKTSYLKTAGKSLTTFLHLQ